MPVVPPTQLPSGTGASPMMQQNAAQVTPENLLMAAATMKQLGSFGKPSGKAPAQLPSPHKGARR